MSSTERIDDLIAWAAANRKAVLDRANDVEIGSLLHQVRCDEVAMWDRVLARLSPEPAKKQQFPLLVQRFEGDNVVVNIHDLNRWSIAACNEYARLTPTKGEKA